MDELDTNFGRLSTHAAEWRPGGVVAQVSTTTSSNTQSDLNASSVKEFVPGKGWTSTSTMTTGSTTGSTLRTLDNQAHSAEEQSTPEQYQESVQPAGPTPPDPPTFQSLHSMGLPDELWRYYRGLSLAASRQMDPSDPRHRAVPLPYCNAYCLDDDHPLQQRRQQKTQNQTQRRSSFFGYPSQTFCVTSRQDGHLYCLRRFDNVRTVSPKIAAAVSDRWTSIAAIQEHPGLVPVYQCFCAQRAVFFVHQYMPASRTLQERLLTATNAGSSGSSSSHGSVVFSEAIIWSCVCQLVSAIRAVHTNQLAVRSLRLQYILSVSQPQKRLRVRINCLGIVDALEFEARKHVSDLQQQDLRDLGYLILSMACGAEVTSADDMANVTRWEGLLAQNYSPELHNLAMTLIRIGDNVRGRPRPPSIMDVSRALALRCMDEQEQAYRSLDRTEQALSSEYESGRILRLLLKLGFINERPEFGPDRRWAQSGDCYVLTLFRDYVFHQADPGGYPVMDLGHVVTSLNKLDAADEERIVLSSRDGKSLMVVSFADVARCLEGFLVTPLTLDPPENVFKYYPEYTAKLLGKAFCRAKGVLWRIERSRTFKPSMLPERISKQFFVRNKMSKMSVLVGIVLGTLVGLSTGTAGVPIDDTATLVVDSFRVGELIGENFERLSAALGSNGLLAIQPDDSIDFSYARDVAFDRMCRCWSHDQSFLGAVQGTDSGVLSDGKTERTTLGTATLGKTPLPLPDTLDSTCGQDTVESLEYLRDHVSAVSDAFVSALDRLLQGSATGTTSAQQTPHLLRNSYGGTYPTVQSIVKAAKHLEHFHVYSKPQSDDPAVEASSSMHVHTDAGLFLAFVPGQACENSSQEVKDNQSFYVKDASTGVLRRAVFPPGSVAIMLGAGAEHWLQTTFPLAATRHTVRMPPGESRAWYGMMHLVPDVAYVQDEPLRTFDEMREAMVLKREKMATRRFSELPGVDEDISVGCGTLNLPFPSRSTTISPRRRLQHVEGPQSCNNSTNFFCWMSCLDIPDAKSAQGYINEGYSLYCVDPSVLASSGNRVSEAVKPCNENGKVGLAMNTNCMGKWEPTAPGVYAQEVIVQGAQNSEFEEPFCYGGTSMYMNGFNWVGTTCVIYLFPAWVLSSAGKLVAACLGSILFGTLMEYIIRLRRETMSASSGPRYKRLALAAMFYGAQLTMGYSLMLVIMIYSVPLFMSVILGLAGGHVLFNAKDSIVPAKKVERVKINQKDGLVSELKTATCCEGPCEDPCEQGRCDGPCKGSCNDEDEPDVTGSDEVVESNKHNGVTEGCTPCCQHTL